MNLAEGAVSNLQPLMSELGSFSTVGQRLNVRFPTQSGVIGLSAASELASGFATTMMMIGKQRTAATG
jgi:hypothetical protein